jgi:hypothetical protein
MFRRLRLVLPLIALAAPLVFWTPVQTADKADKTASPTGPSAGPIAGPTAGKGTLYIGSYPNQFWIIDEATAKIVGTIPFTTGIPRRTTLSRDHKRFYTIEAHMEKVEIIDIASRKTVDTFSLSEGTKTVRIRSIEPDPLHRFVILVTKAVTKQIDRFEIGPPLMLQYDLASHQVVRTIPWPNGEERENANIQFSPDGKLMYLFSDQDVLIYETDSFKQIDKWELSKPVEEGFGTVAFGATDAMNDEPGYYTGLFTVQDPVQHRRTMGIGRVNLSAKSVDFYTLGPATPVSFALTPGRKFAYGLFSEIGRYEFWKFDLEHKKLSGRTEFTGRPRMSLKTSSNGQVLYIYNAGNTIDRYDAATYKYLNTITLTGDMTTDLFVFPPASPATPSS